MKAPDFLAIALSLLSVGGGYYMNTLSRRVARVIGISLMAIGGAGLLVWFVYLRGIVELPTLPSSGQINCQNTVGGDNSAPLTNSCKQQ
jgi:hypothetical protein